MTDEPNVERVVDQASAEIARLEHQLESVRADVSIFEEENNRLREELANMRRREEILQNDLAYVRNTRNEFREEITRLRELLMIAVRLKLDSQEECDKLRTQLAGAQIRTGL